jgi:hypothetical protein
MKFDPSTMKPQTIAEFRAVAAADLENEPLIDPAELWVDDDSAPCGECHLQPGETCDICGRQS